MPHDISRPHEARGAKLIVGCGYLGLRVAQLWRNAGHQVHAVTRSPARADELARAGLAPLVADVTTPDHWPSLPRVDTLLYAVGHDRTAAATIEQVYAAGLQNVLDRLSDQVERVIYISSTGVYGQAQGETIDESTPPLPQRHNARACLQAEQVLAHHRLAARSIVLRLAGIYGPGRIPRAEQLARGVPLAADPDGWLNLIHVDDAAAVVVAAERQAPRPRLYLVSDGRPVLRREFYAELARHIHADTPRFIPPDETVTELQRAGSDKRIDNRRMLDELHVALRYPSYREGLQAIYE